MKNLKSVFVGFLTALLLAQSAQAGISFYQYTRLAKHFEVHFKSSGDSFLSFLFLHYGAMGSKHFPKDSSHKDLPSKAHLNLGIDQFQLQNIDFPVLEFTFSEHLGFYFFENPYFIFQKVPIEPPKEV